MSIDELLYSILDENTHEDLTDFQTYLIGDKHMQGAVKRFVVYEINSKPEETFDSVDLHPTYAVDIQNLETVDYLKAQALLKTALRAVIKVLDESDLNDTYPYNIVNVLSIYDKGSGLLHTKQLQLEFTDELDLDRDVTEFAEVEFDGGLE